MDSGGARRIALLDAYAAVDPLELCMEVFLDGHELPPQAGSGGDGCRGRTFDWGMIAAAFGRTVKSNIQIYMAGDVKISEATIDDWYRVDGRRERRRERMAMGLTDDGAGGRLTREDRIDIFLSKSRLTNVVEFVRLKRPAVRRALDELKARLITPPREDQSSPALPEGVVPQFRSLDKNGDKQISLDELSPSPTDLYKAIGEAAGAGEAKEIALGERIFQRADVDGDAAVTEAELAAAIAEYKLDVIASASCYQLPNESESQTKATLVHELLRNGLTYRRIAKELERLIGSTKLAATGYSRLSAESIATMAWPVSPKTSKAQYDECKRPTQSLPQSTHLGANIKYLLSIFLPGPELGLGRWRAGQEFSPDSGRGALYRVVSASLVPGTARHEAADVVKGANVVTGANVVKAASGAKPGADGIKVQLGRFKANITVEATKKGKGTPEDQICYQKRVAILRNFRRLLGPLAAEATWDLDVAPPVESLRTTERRASVKPEKTDAQRRAEARQVAAKEVSRGRTQVVQAKGAAAEAKQARDALIAQRRLDWEGYDVSNRHSVRSPGAMRQKEHKARAEAQLLAEEKAKAEDRVARREAARAREAELKAREGDEAARKALHADEAARKALQRHEAARKTLQRHEAPIISDYGKRQAEKRHEQKRARKDAEGQKGATEDAERQRRAEQRRRRLAKRADGGKLSPSPLLAPEHNTNPDPDPKRNLTRRARMLQGSRSGDRGGSTRRRRRGG